MKNPFANRVKQRVVHYIYFGKDKKYYVRFFALPGIHLPGIHWCRKHGLRLGKRASTV
jgi:hypothetical protein